jgi:glycolate oxidase iron-sulfur subunit
MKTTFPAELLADPQMHASEKIIRTCVHCGFCTATCPTYLLRGDELDSPRGRIYLIKDMLENNRPAGAREVLHVDRCLSCLACMTTCPSGVNYMHLVDHARAHIARTFKRPLPDRMLRGMLSRVLPSRSLFRLALLLARIGRPMAPVVARIPRVGSSLRAMLSLAPAQLPARIASEGPGQFRSAAQPASRRRVALLTGCAQAVLAPQINAAVIRLVNRAGVDVVMPRGESCCGALVHHMGFEDRALRQARANVDAWMKEIAGGGLEAIVIAASGCGTTIKDYSFMLRNDPAYAENAARVSALAKDVTEYLSGIELPFTRLAKIRVAYHSACSMQHGQKITQEPKALLRRAGFDVRDVPEGHICCGSAGVYNILQPEIAGQLRARKVANIAKVHPQLIAAGNIGCIAQIGSGTQTPVVHTAELLDWACGGPAPEGAQAVLAKAQVLPRA